MNKLIGTIVVIGFPIVVFVVSYLATPGYFMPMFSNPLGIGMLVAAFIWLVIGFFVLMITGGWLRSLLAVVFTTPVILMCMLGPAVITIASALGPVLGSDDSTDSTVNSTESPANTSSDTTVESAPTTKVPSAKGTAGGAKKTKTQD